MDALKTTPYVTVVQLTDSHLFAGLHDRLMGMQTDHSLEQVIELIATEQAQIDLLMCTGDISQDGSIASYQRFAQKVGRLGAPMRWLAGNHDERLALQQVCAHTDRLEPVYDLGAWRIVVLDSSVPEHVYGQLAQDQLAILQQALSRAGERHVLIAVHHHPLPIKSLWMDKIGLRNADQLLSIISRYPQVKAVICGHVHQEFDQQLHGVRWLATPSTCMQFTPYSADFAVDDSAPGYRCLRLYDDGQVQTTVSRLDARAFAVDHSDQGY
ncbi:MAG: 3',5'-cyclic-AMP phosphodiesterase [Pseudomonas sp.]|nr:3',5'-cyclic-AMP phosphodiesterase [Pseudomonas sp.]MDD2222943.1 3',5'-cyclic-AMP phosphodiesterase [Pseudomonas sp.]MDY0415293.1 3',5'-cyclic-AMP phosphodiesterase [Pseudomonas sp.]NLO53768.1 3',5'-cyclic-AMP phosphodiesterase [Gammaproteobacteria bacterium]